MQKFFIAWKGLRKQVEHDNKFDEIFDAIQSKDIKPEKGIFLMDRYLTLTNLCQT